MWRTRAILASTGSIRFAIATLEVNSVMNCVTSTTTSNTTAWFRPCRPSSEDPIMEDRPVALLPSARAKPPPSKNSRPHGIFSFRIPQVTMLGDGLVAANSSYDEELEKNLRKSQHIGRMNIRITMNIEVTPSFTFMVVSTSAQPGMKPGRRKMYRNTAKMNRRPEAFSWKVIGPRFLYCSLMTFMVVNDPDDAMFTFLAASLFGLNMPIKVTCRATQTSSCMISIGGVLYAMNQKKFTELEYSGNSLQYKHY